ncbi:glycosyltransferase [Microbacterium sp. KSW2-21]|uniref:Glycosyltransferase n=1 Tax=Microbacterium algihabitans TaxID=3075992 RepID=A0ABU3RVQ1_9MICO|nr:glycosyltransferase [Microbacterium sp. KSW2-21]MDU0326860.1 glycosyltransferase [Microbacterium sp. KSW2-21]
MQQASPTLFFGLNYPPETTGISPYTGAMASGLARRGRKVRALVGHPHYPDWKVAPGYGQWSLREIIDGVSVERLRHFVPSRPTPMPRAAAEISFGLRQAFARWGRPAVIVTVSPALISSALVRLRARVTHPNTPFVVWVQDLYGAGLAETGQNAGLAARAIGWIEGWLLRSASKVVVIHDRFADRVVSNLGVLPERAAVVRNWTHLGPTPNVDVAAVRRSYGWAADEIVVAHTGNMGVKQGLHHVVDAGRLAHRTHEKVRFVLVGRGSQRDELAARIDEEPTTTEIMPPLDDVAFAEVLQAADILLVNELPGVSEMCVPSKLTSYFSSGRPVLAATDLAGITAHEVAAADAGMTVIAGDPDALLQGAKALAADRAQAVRLGENGKRYKETVLDETFAIDRFDSLLADLTAAPGGQAPPHPKIDKDRHTL